MIDNSEMPIGFTMELAQPSDILTRFAELPESRRNDLVDGARNVESRNEMRNYVESMFRENVRKFGIPSVSQDSRSAAPAPLPAETFSAADRFPEKPEHLRDSRHILSVIIQ